MIKFANKFRLGINDQALIDLVVCAVVLSSQKELVIDDFVMEFNYNNKMKSFLENELELTSFVQQAYFLHYLWFKIDLDTDVYILEKTDNMNHHHQTLACIKQEIGLDLRKTQCVEKYICNLEMKIQHAHKTQFRSFKYSPKKKELTYYLNVSKVLSYIIYQDLSQKYMVPFFFDWWINLAMFIYNKAYTVPNVYKKLDIIIINPHKKYFNESFVYRSDLDLSDIKVHYHYEHELTYLDLNKYDAILAIDTDLNLDQKTSIPIINFDYYVKQKEYRTIWNKILMNKKKKDLMSKQLLEEIKPIENEALIIDLFYENLPYQHDIYMNSREDFKKISENFQKDMGYFDWVIFVNDDNDTEIMVQNDRYYSKISLAESLLSVKQAESLIRRKVSSHFVSHSK